MRLGFGMMAEIDGQPRRAARLAAQQKSHRRGARRVALQGFDEWRGATRLRHTGPAVSSVGRFGCRPILPARRPGRASVLLSGTACSKRPPGVASKALRLSLQHGFLMSGIEHELVAVVGALMAGDFQRRHPESAPACRRRPGSAAGRRLPAGWSNR